MTRLPLLPPQPVRFPPVEAALHAPNGLLAAGGALTPDWLLTAYSRGIFPWYTRGQPILWWSPDPRMVLYPDEFHVSRSFRKCLRRHPYRLSCNEAFAQVITRCSRRDGTREPDGTWLVDEMIEAFRTLHDHGHAHSVEVWDGTALVGGLYGVSIGKVFSGESMFSLRDNASKLALHYLAGQLRERGFGMIDCQLYSDHLHSLGAVEISRLRFARLLEHYGASRAVATRPHPHGRAILPSVL